MNASVISLFVAGASDVATELTVIRGVIDEWNTTHAADRATYITLTSWKDSAHPEAGTEPQAIINRQVLDSADIVVGVFWTRFGTPTATAGSGTEEEIERSIAAGKTVMVYFSDRPIPPSLLDAVQYGRILDFKKRYATRGLYSEFSDLETFRSNFRRHLAQVVNDNLGRTTSEQVHDAISIAFPEKYWVVILGALRYAVRKTLNQGAALHAQGVQPEDISDTGATILAGPLIAYTRIIDVLVKHGVLKSSAEDLGYEALMREIRDLQNGKPKAG